MEQEGTRKADQDPVADLINRLPEGKITLSVLWRILPRLQLAVPLMFFSLLALSFGLGVAFVEHWSPEEKPDALPGPVDLTDETRREEQELLDEIRAKRVSVYYRLVRFADRAKGMPPFESRFVGYKRNGLYGVEEDYGIEADIYDEAITLVNYTLYPHRVAFLQQESASSGLTHVTAVEPRRMIPKVHDYARRKFGTLRYDIPLQSSDPDRGGLQNIAISRQYINGYQYHEGVDRYESDGGYTVLYRTDELSIIVDFSAVEEYLSDSPQMVLVKNESESRIGSYENGVLTTEPIRDLEPGHEVRFDWEWSTERSSP